MSIPEVSSPGPASNVATRVPRSPKPRVFPSEHAEQCALMEWVRWWTPRLPALARLYAIPNGGQRGKAQAGKLKAEGVRKGVLDLALPVARGGWFGLYIEMKAKDGRLTPEQRAEITALALDGYLGLVAYGMQEAVQIIEWYLAKQPTKIAGPRLVPPFKGL